MYTAKKLTFFSQRNGKVHIKIKLKCHQFYKIKSFYSKFELFWSTILEGLAKGSKFTGKKIIYTYIHTYIHYIHDRHNIEFNSLYYRGNFDKKIKVSDILLKLLCDFVNFPLNKLIVEFSLAKYFFIQITKQGEGYLFLLKTFLINVIKYFLFMLRIFFV